MFLCSTPGTPRPPYRPNTCPCSSNTPERKIKRSAWYRPFFLAGNLFPLLILDQGHILYQGTIDRNRTTTKRLGHCDTGISGSPHLSGSRRGFSWRWSLEVRGNTECLDEAEGGEGVLHRDKYTPCFIPDLCGREVTRQ